MSGDEAAQERSVENAARADRQGRLVSGERGKGRSGGRPLTFSKAGASTPLFLPLPLFAVIECLSSGPGQWTPKERASDCWRCPERERIDKQQPGQERFCIKCSSGVKTLDQRSRSLAGRRAGLVLLGIA